MTRPILAAIAALGLLAGCGADGEPFEPTASVGVGVNSRTGVSTEANVGATNGSFSFNLGLKR